MTRALSPADRPTRPSRSRRLRLGRIAALSALLGLTACGWLATRNAAVPVLTVTAPRAAAPLAIAVMNPAPARESWLMDPNPVLDARAPAGWERPLAAGFRSTAMAVPAGPARPVREEMAALAIAPASPSVPLPQPVPLPLARPPEFQTPQAPRLAALVPTRRRTAVPSSEPVASNASLFERLFGVHPSTGPALAYATPGGESIGTGLGGLLGTTPAPSSGTAIYDIGANTVTLPSGERLEAHSGLGSSMDDPRYAHLRMRGPTPPGTYDLTEREALFHGVRALRLSPVGGSAAIHGRDGLLAHTYMLGPTGASNGCVSFRDYQRFLQAYLRGEVRRLIVIAGRGDGGPASRRFGQFARSER